MSPKRRQSWERPIAVKCLDPATGKSLSFTVYPCLANPLEFVAKTTQGALRRRWKTTELNDRRHKRRRA